MKKIFITLLYLCTVTLGLSAQDLSEIDPTLLPKGITIDGDSVHVDLRVLLSDSTYRKAIIDEMNKRSEQKGSHTQITQMSFEEAKEPAASRPGMRKAEVLTDKLHVQLYTTYDYHYQSVDTDNQPITLSGRMYVPSSVQLSFTMTSNYYFVLTVAAFPFKLITSIVDLIYSAATDQIKWGVLDCHPTVTSNYESPSGGNAPTKQVASMTSERALVVCPDYLGYGYTKNMQHPYLIQDITARNCVDGYLAALDIVHGKVDSWSDNFYTTIVGYSQGGSVALACTKYLQSGMVSQADRDRINLRETYCGDGPYCPVATVKTYLNWANVENDTRYSNLAYPCVLPLIIAAAKQYYDKGCMRTVKLEDYFTPEFLATGIVEDLKSKVVTTADLNEKTKHAGIYTLDQMMSDKMIIRDENGKLAFNTETNEYKALMRALDKADLTKGWMPEKPVYFLHFEGDLVVPYSNVEAIPNGFATRIFGANEPYFSLNSTWRTGLAMVEWDLVNNIDENDDVSKQIDYMNHVSVGTLFYIWFMAGCPYDLDEDNYLREIIN